MNGYWNPVGGLGWEEKVKQDVTADYLGVELQSNDPLELAELWGKVAGLPIERNGAEFSMNLNNVNIRFVEEEDSRGAGLGGLDILVENRDHILTEAEKRDCFVSEDRVDICGTRWYLHDN
jgi:hypothetical protein